MQIEELNIGTDPYAAEWHIQMMAEKGFTLLSKHRTINGFQIGRFAAQPPQKKEGQ